MIFDSLENRELYRALPDVYRALCLVAQFGSDLTEEGFQTEDGRIRLNPQTIRTMAEELRMFEAHRRFIDVHCTLCGTEVIQVQDVSRLHTETEFDTEKDFGFYAGTAQAVCRLQKGQFLVCYPSDAHKVCIADGAPETVRKIVVKIKAEA